MIAGFNPAGSPVFQRLVREPVLSEGQYVSVWKAYIFSLVGNWLLGIAGDEYSENFKSLAAMLEETDLRSKDDNAETIFSKITNTLQSFLSRNLQNLRLRFLNPVYPYLRLA